MDNRSQSLCGVPKVDHERPSVATLIYAKVATSHVANGEQQRFQITECVIWNV
jgi:hypothetical protein